MYSRFKGFIFLTALIFAVVGAIAFFQKYSAGVKAPVATNDTITEQKPQASVARIPIAEEIPLNWRSDIGVPVLCYHQIVTEQKYRQKPTPYAVTVKQFREQMQWLADHNFYTILPDELLAYTQGKKQLDFSQGRRPIVLTFDDGNNDFADHAPAILDAHKFKGVLFIYPTYIFAKKPRSLTWAQIKSIAKAGHAIESHTMWHPMLNSMTDAEQRAQFADSKRILDEKAGVQVSHLAYPFGVYNDKSLELLEATGYKSAHTTFHGGNQIGEHPFLLRRFLIVKSDNPRLFAQKTLARSLPIRYLNSKPGAVFVGEGDLKFRLPAKLSTDGLKVKIFSTPQSFTYDSQSGELAVNVKLSKKRLSVLDIIYRDAGVDYRASALLNHKRNHELSKATSKKTHKKRKKKSRKRNQT